MQLARTLLRFTLTLVAAYGVLTALLWHAPGRDLEDTMWSGSAAPGAVRWTSYPEFTRWYAAELLHGRAGHSHQLGSPVHELIAERAPVTFSHAWRGFAAAWGAALLTGVLSHHWPAAGRLALGAGSLLLSLPAAFLIVALFLGGASPWLGLAVCVWPKTYSYWETILQMARRRTHVLQALAQGAGPWQVQWLSIWRPNLRALLGLGAVSVPLVLGTLIPVEVLCDEPGLGQLAWRAVAGRDLPLLTSLTLLFTAATCAMSLLAESILPEHP